MLSRLWLKPPTRFFVARCGPEAVSEGQLLQLRHVEVEHWLIEVIPKAEALQFQESQAFDALVEAVPQNETLEGAAV